MPALAFELAREGWQVEADGRAFRAPGEVRATVRSGVDWFDLDGEVSYGDVQATLSSVLEAQRRGDDMVLLSDGSYGMLPSAWLAKLGPLVSSGTPGENGTRFKRTQVTLLNALLASMPGADVDATFARAREQLAGFDRIEPVNAPDTFVGTLREYQREGLGWLHFLREFGFGGCLADDMGLGKTIQVLALLEARRAEGHGPSLVVVPRSLVFNWRREAERFAPHMRVLDWSATERSVDTLDTREVDVLLVTYGTLRRDVVQLASFEFDYVVLDEAQAIKNSATATAKATRLLQARNRLALSGTPIENRIEELWSVLDFLNPGMLGASHRFSSMLRADVTDDSVSELDAHEVLARALRPVILRRTKAEVAPELPERLENTLEVEMEPEQRAYYNEVRDSYRANLLRRIDRDGVSKSRMHILEALLRLRQVACHPSLADPRKANLPSAKLDALLPALAEVSAEGNKALVFSQFTEFLSLVRNELDEQGIAYEYLDGRTRDRQARVDRFQNDPACPLFLISLKAGGHGLNLTAADYVFLLDPWWNPAVEAQAIDRAHRIGRERRVIATRLVARDTIEEKILQLQASKRSLADAILTADKGVMASIGREELELLLG
jgi:SNF2 family DNA or RNA helicase